MSRHILVIEPDAAYAARFPGSPVEYTSGIECPAGNGCSGWIECDKPHRVDGKSAADGPDDCDEGDPWEGQDEIEFHGVLHTWRCGWGWTAPYPGCVVQGTDYEVPDDLYPLKPGRYVVEDDWDDCTCILETIGNESEADK